MSATPSTVVAVNPQSRQHLIGISYGMAAGAVWGLVFVAPALVSDFHPLLLSIGRYLCYGLMATALIAPRWKALSKRLRPQQWLNLAWLAFTGNIFYFVLLAAAVQIGGIAMTSLVLGLVPVAVTLIGSRDRNAVPLSRLVPSLLMCGFAAVCVGWGALATPSDIPAGQQALGLLCAFGALASWTVFTVSNSRCLRRWRSISAYEWNLLVGTVTGLQSLLLIPFALLFTDTSHTADAWLRLGAVSVAISVLASLVGNSFWNRMSRLLPLTLAGQMILFETVFALVYCFFWEQRLPTLLELAALIAVLLGVFFCMNAHRRPAEKVIGA